MSDTTTQTNRHWGDQRRRDYYAAGGLTWLDVPAVLRRHNERVTGDPNREPLRWVVEEQLAGRTPVVECLSLCCGDGHVERMLAALGAFEHCTAYDLAEGLLVRAREEAERLGHGNIEYVRADLNTIALPTERYDLIVSEGGLHHLHALEHVAEQLAGALRPDGLFATNEYVGPNRFQYSERQHELCEAALRLLPEKYRRSVSFERHGRVGAGADRTAGAWARLTWAKLRKGTLLAAVKRRLHHASTRNRGGALLKETVARFAGEEIALDDPSEAVRSQDILSVLEQHLDLFALRPYGGALLMPVLDDIAGNFGDRDPVAQELLQMLFTIEDTLIDSGELQSDFAYLVARRRR